MKKKHTNFLRLFTYLHVAAGTNAISILFRSLYDASLSPLPDQFAYLAESVGHVSDLQMQTAFSVKVLQNNEKIKNCKDHEEDEGRMNCDMLNRFVIVGGQLVQNSEDMQGQLVHNVSITYFNI
jgi:hypothetical protein